MDMLKEYQESRVEEDLSLKILTQRLKLLDTQRELAALRCERFANIMEASLAEQKKYLPGAPLVHQRSAPGGSQEKSRTGEQKGCSPGAPSVHQTSEPGRSLRRSTRMREPSLGQQRSLGAPAGHRAPEPEAPRAYTSWSSRQWRESENDVESAMSSVGLSDLYYRTPRPVSSRSSKKQRGGLRRHSDSFF